MGRCLSILLNKLKKQVISGAAIYGLDGKCKDMGDNGFSLFPKDSILTCLTNIYRNKIKYAACMLFKLFIPLIKVNAIDF